MVPPITSVGQKNGRSRERSTGTADREQAEIVFAEWLQVRGRKHGPSDPATDTLTDYANERGPKVASPRVIGCAISAMTPYWQGLTVAEVTPLTCGRYVDWRDRSLNTARRELAVLQAAINWGYKNGKLTRPVAVTLPTMPECNVADAIGRQDLGSSRLPRDERESADRGLWASSPRPHARCEVTGKNSSAEFPRNGRMLMLRSAWC